MAFKGVRMSWDMLKRKTLLARLAASAASLACFMARVCSVTSRMPTSMWGWPGRLRSRVFLLKSRRGWPDSTASYSM